jgi:hypothetical protein
VGTRTTLAAAAVLAAAIVTPRAAHGGDDAPGVRDPDEAPPAPPPPKPKYALQLDPLAWFIGRFGADFEALVASHHALTATLHGDYLSNGFDILQVGSGDTKYSGFGGELGWHIYVLPGELRGYWIGPSFVFGVYEQGTTSQPATTFTQTGIAIDTGARFGTAGFGLDLGVGIQVARLSNPNEWGGPVQLFAAQVRPRMLLAVGWVF